MSEEVKKTGRPVTKKVETKVEDTTTDVVIEDKEKEALKLQNEQMAEMLKQMQEQLLALQANIQPQVVTPVSTSSLVGKKIKCINLMNNPVNISTEPDGQGRTHSFDKYGDTKLIKFDELADIVSAYPNTMASGAIFIANKEAVIELGLEDDYENIHTKEVLDEAVYLRRDSDVDIIIGLNEVMRDSILIRVAELMNANETMDFNRLRRIKDATGKDVEEIATDLKENPIKMI